MPYIVIVLAASIALVVKFLFLTDAAVWSKWLVAGLLGLCLAGNFHFLHLGLTGLFLQVGLCIYIAIYLLCASVRR